MDIAVRAGALVGLVGLYFLLAGEISGAEAIACLPVIALSSIYAVAAGRTRSVPMRVGLHGAGALARSLLGVPPEMVRVGGALVRAIVKGPSAVQGATIHVPFRFEPSSAKNIGRRAAEVTALSLAPNGIVLGMHHQADELIVHQLIPQPIRGNRTAPG